MADSRELAIVISAKDIASAVMDKVGASVGAVGGSLTQLMSAGEQLASGIGHSFEAIGATVGGTFQQVAAHVSEMVGGTFDKLKSGIGTVVDKFGSLASEGLSMGGMFGAVGAAIGVGVGVAVTAIVGMSAAIIELGERGSHVADVHRAFDGLTESMGLAGGAVLDKLRAGTHGLVDDYTLMQSSTKAMRAGFKGTADDFETLGAGARVLAKGVGGETKQAFEDLMQAMVSGRTRGLTQTYGALIEVKGASTELKDALKALNEESTSGADADAKRGAVMIWLRDEIAKNGNASLDFGEKIKTAKVFVSNFTDSLAEAVAKSPAVNAALDQIEKAIAKAFGANQKDTIQKLIGIVDSFAIGLFTMAEGTVLSAKYVVQAFDGLHYFFDMLQGGMQIVVGGFQGAIAAIAIAASNIPGVGDKFKGIAHTMTEAAVASVNDGKAWLKSADDVLDGAGTRIAAFDATYNALATVKKGMQDAVAAGVSVEEQTHKIAGAAGEAAEKDGARTKAIQEVNKQMRELSGLLIAAGDSDLSLQEIEKLHGAKLKELSLQARALGQAIPESMQDWTDAINEETFTKALDQANAKALKIVQGFDDARMKSDLKATETQVKNADTALKATEPITKQYAELFMTASEKAIAAADIQREKSLMALEPLKTSAPEIYATMAARVNVIYDSMVTSAAQSVHKQVGLFATMAGDLPGVIAAAVQNGGSVSSAIEKYVGGELFDVNKGPLGSLLRGGVEKLGLAIGGDFGAKLASSLTNIIPGLGAVIGPAVGALFGKVTAMFGSAGRDAVTAFADSMGGFDALHAKIDSLGSAGQGLWVALTQGVGKNNPAQAKTIIDQITAAFAAQGAAAQKSAADTAAAYAAAQQGIGSALGKVITGTIGTQDEFDRLSRIALNTFNTLVKSGVAPVDAMQQIGSSVDVLIASLDKSGLQGSAAYEQLARWRTLTSVNAPLLDQIGSLNSLMSMTATLGGMNADVFKDMETQGESAYDKLIKAGFTQSEATKQLAPLLQQEIQLNKDKGFAIDDATQKIIAQGVANGDLEVANESMTDVFKEGISALILAIGGKLPEAWAKAAKAAKDTSDGITTALAGVGAHGVAAISSIAAAIGQLPDNINIDVNGVWHPPKGDGGSGEDNHPAFATEAFVRSPTLAMIGDVAGGEFVLKPSTVHHLMTQSYGAGQVSGAGGGNGSDLSAILSELRLLRQERAGGVVVQNTGDVVVQSILTLDGQVIDKRSTRAVKRGIASGEILMPKQNVVDRVAG